MQSGLKKAEHVRQVIAKLARMLAQQGITVTQRGTTAYCRFNNRTGKPEQINLPVIPPDPSERFIAALHGYLDHEVAHALETNSKDWTSGVFDPNNAATTSSGFRNNVINVVEDVRIENVMPKRFPGSEANLQAVRQFIIDEVWAPQLAKLDMNNPAHEGKIRTVTLVPYLRAVGGHRACRDWVDSLGLARFFTQLHTAIPDLEGRFKALTSTADAAKLADDLILAINPPKPPPPEEEPEDEGDEQSLGEPDGGDQDDEPMEPDVDQDDAGDAEDEGDGGEEADADDKSEPGDEGEGEDEGDGTSGDSDGDGDGSQTGEGDKPSDDEGKPKKSGGDKDGPKETPKSKLGEAMKLLKPKQRRALFLYNRKRMDVEQIAETMKISAADASRHLKDARRRLSLIMKEL